MAAADRDHCCVLGDGDVDRPGHGRGEVRRAGDRIGWNEDDVEAGAGRYRVHDLGVFDLFGARHVGRAGPREGGRDLELRRGQAELAVERGQVLADVGEIGPRAVGKLGHHDGLAFAGDPALEQRRHAVGHLVLAGGVALDEKARRPARQRTRHRPYRRCRPFRAVPGGRAQPTQTPRPGTLRRPPRRPGPPPATARRGLCPGHVTACGIRRTIDLTGMTAVSTASTSLGTCFIEQSPHLRLEGCHLPGCRPAAHLRCRAAARRPAQRCGRGLISWMWRRCLRTGRIGGVRVLSRGRSGGRSHGRRAG